MKKKLLLSFLLFSFIQTQAQWNLVWSDEFNASAINTANWIYETGAGGWGNNELENYTNRPINSIISNGNLLIIAKKENYGGSAYTSARMKSEGLHSWTYGKIEAKIKLPIGQGVWPGFWMLGDNISFVGWPKCGEIDIMEHINSESKIYGTMHWDNAGHVSYGTNVACTPTQWHVYSIEWDANAIKWFLDGNKYWEGDIFNNINSTNEFHSSFFILLNMAVGGSWPGNPDGTTVFPDTMFVDYVRVYQQGATMVKDIQNSIGSIENYPNPFIGSTTISYTVSKQAIVELSIWDLLGNKVAVLENGKKLAGNYSIVWDSENFAHGMYLLKLNLDGQMNIKKVIIE